MTLHPAYPPFPFDQFSTLLRRHFSIAIASRYLTSKPLSMIDRAVFGTALLVLSMWACQSEKKPADQQKNASAASITYPYEKPDSAFGFAGCDKALYKADSAGSFELFYGTYRVQVKEPTGSTPGQQITIVIDSTGTPLQLPPLDEGGYFQGKWGNHFFVDLGTAPDVRRLNVYKEENGALYQVFQTEYLPHEAPVVASTGSLWFYGPIAEADMEEKPVCPDAEQWRKDGLRIGYGQRRLYDMRQRMYVRKSEYTCVPMQ